MSRFATATLLAFTLAPLCASAAPHGQKLVSLPQATPPPMTPGTYCYDMPHLGNASNGAMIQHVKIVDIFYSPGHKYKTQLEDFYKAITQSAYFDWLTEYNGPSYKISRGSFALTFEDTNPNPSTVQTINPETYLKGLISAKKVPAPDADTLYMIYFPSGIDPNDGSGGSCISNGNFCAYHSNYQSTAGMVRYGVMPDMEAGNCSMGCGPAGLDSFTDVSSHEMIEAVTDPDGTGWYDDAVPANDQNNCGEIGDICAVGGTAEGAMVAGYFVQNEWSNKNNKCISVDPSAVLNDFTIALSPSEVSIPVGGSATVTVTLTKKSGTSDNIGLTAPTPPTGLTAAFAPASVQSDGGTSTLTVSAGPSLTPGGALTVTVKGTGTGGAVSEMATLNVSIVDAPPDMATGGSGGTGGNGGSGGSGGGSGNHGGGGGCSVGGGSFGGGWGFVALALLALAFRRRRA